MNFSSDTSASAHPDVLAALSEANVGPAPSYGADDWMDRARGALCNAFETELDFWLVASGTAANALGLSVLCPPTDAILCHREAHIEKDERGAVTFFSGGAQLDLLPGEHGRIDLAALEARLANNRRNFVHETPATCLSVSNLTEAGTVYTAEAIAQIAERAHAADIKVHLDGARFANALVSTGASAADLSWRAGVDVMSFGATKNGAIGCEAILLFGQSRNLRGELETRAKRAGMMPPKMRFMAAQMCAMLQGGLWMDLARQANAAATRLSEVLTSAGGRLAHPVDGNEVFINLPAGLADHLAAAGASFYAWPDGSHRFVCAWNTDEDTLAALERSVAAWSGAASQSSMRG